MSKPRPTPEGPTVRPTMEPLPLFDQPMTTLERVLLHDIDVPDIRTPAPSAAGSASSIEAAACVSEPFRRRSHRLILTALAAGGRALASMHEIAAITDIPVHTVSARLADLVPVWIECVDKACLSPVKPTLHINGYRLTAAGLSRWQQANEPLSGRGSKEEAAA